MTQMATSDGTTGARFSVRFGSELNAIVEQIQNELDYQAGASEEITKSDVIRDFVREGVAEMYLDGDLPEETADLVEDVFEGTSYEHLISQSDGDGDGDD